MKITAVTPVPVSSGTPFGARNYMFVKMETDEGFVGWDEATSGAMSFVPISASDSIVSVAPASLS